MTSNRLVLWAGSYTDPDFPVAKKGEGITALEFDPSTGDLRILETVSDVNNPSYLAVHPSGQFVYAVNERMAVGQELPGTVSAFRVGVDGRSLHLLNEVASEGVCPCHLTLDPSGRHVFVANYSSGTVAHLPLGDDGRLQPAQTVDQHTGQGPKPGQGGPRAHMVLFSKDGKILYSADLGTDSLWAARWDAASGRLAPADRTFATAPGAGPRHLVHHPTLDRLYAVNELNGTVEVFAVTAATGALERVQTISTLGPDDRGEAGCGAIRISDDGRFLYASNRTDVQTLVVYAVDPVSGHLVWKQSRSSGGRGPRDLVLDPTGHFVLVANQETGTVAVFRRNLDTGLLSGTGRAVSLPLVVSLVFAP